METTFKIKCRNCDKEAYFSSYQFDSKACEKNKCWLRTHKARAEAAVLKGCNAEDFLNPISGKIRIADEPEKVQQSYTSVEGRWVNNKWVPWKEGSNDYECY